jgi:hypothetical protein
MNDHFRANQHIQPLTNKRIKAINNRNAEGLKRVLKVY